MKKPQPSSFRPLLRSLGLVIRGGASYLALAGGLASVAWLSTRLEAVPSMPLGPWGQLEELTPLVVLDAGHGGHDGGAVAGGVIEKKLTLELTLLLRDQLTAQGLRVKMTREGDAFLPLEERAALANEAEADAFVSLHLNTSATAQVSGIETYYTERKSLAAQRAMQAKWSLTSNSVQDLRGRWLADSLQRHACFATDAHDRGIKQRNYAVVSQTQVPSALIECGFLTHPDEAARLKKADYQKRLIAGIATGITQFLKAQQGQSTRGLQLMAAEPEPLPEETEAPTP